MFTKFPFVGPQGNLDGWQPPTDQRPYIVCAAANFRYAGIDLPRYISPLEPERQNTMPQYSPLDDIVAPPLFRTSGVI